MATLLRMPEVAANATHATVVAWTKKEGDAVAVGDCIAEIETEKAVVEYISDWAGVMGVQLVKGGQEIEVGAPIGVLLSSADEKVDDKSMLTQAGLTSEPARQAEPASAGIAARAQEAISTFAPLPVASAQGGRIFASPLARRLALQHGLQLSGLSASGPNGRIIKRDVENAAALRQAPAQEIQTWLVTPVAVDSSGNVSGSSEHPHTSMRRTIARRLTESKTTIPHFYLSSTCRLDRLLALRAEINAHTPKKISINDFIIRAVAVALRQVPSANVSWTDTAMRHYEHADIAVAVSTDTGLITPIVRRADTKALSTISAEIADLAARARAGQLRPEEYQGGSFSVSNLGMFGVPEFSAIINPPQAAILAVGATQQQPVVQDGQVVIGSVMTVTLSVDHRAIDGAVAAQWLAAFKGLIATPLSMLV